MIRPPERFSESGNCRIAHRFQGRIAALDIARESCVRSSRTFPEESINGDSIEVVRQESASENDYRIEACVGDREERREDVARPEAQELDETHRTIGRNTEVRCEAAQHTRQSEAITGDAHQARCDDGAPAGRYRREARRSGRRALGRKRQRPGHDLRSSPRVA